MDMAAFLLSHGADPNVKDPKDGLTTEQGLRRHGLIELADFLRDERTKRAIPPPDQS
jgi:hypothetical protein